MSFARKVTVRMLAASLLLGAPAAVMAQSSQVDNSDSGQDWRLTVITSMLDTVATLGASACENGSGALSSVTSLFGNNGSSN